MPGGSACQAVGEGGVIAIAHLDYAFINLPLAYQGHRLQLLLAFVDGLTGLALFGQK